MTKKSDTNQADLLAAILPHVAFEGWSVASFVAAVDDVDISMEEARSICPRGAIDLAIAFHREGDAAMVACLAKADLSDMRFRDKVATALRFRVEAMTDKEAVRRASTHFALPMHAPDGARLIWETADHVWNALGDTSRDGNWYSKRATLSGVWAATVLYWLGDVSVDHTETMNFIDRRIDNVMKFEELKAGLRKNPMTKPLMSLQASLFEKLHAPDSTSLDNLPGRWKGPVS
jgi:ubiquinone biosynthesis protein COQ9